jgi:hypothetical protein
MSTTPSETGAGMELNDDLYIIVPKWERFQHYRDRHPTWIKVYSRLLHDPKFLGLSLAARGLLITIWLLFGQTLGDLRVRDARRLAVARGGFGVQLISLSDAGFIELSASRLLATKKEKEREEEKEKALEDPVENQLLTEAFNVAAGWDRESSDDFEQALDELERRFKGRLSPSRRMDLWDVALNRKSDPW